MKLVANRSCLIFDFEYFLQTAAGNVGSCEYDLEPIVEASKLCPDYCPEGQLNQLPYGPGKYGGTWTKPN